MHVFPSARAAFAAASLLLGSLAAAGRARAAQDETCAKAYETAQELRADGLLRAARDVLRMCVRASCQGFIRADCNKWLNDVEGGLPSVVFVARLAGKDLETVSVVCDDELLGERLDGRAIELDPGKHSCRFEAPGTPPTRMELLVVEGQKNRVVAVELGAPPAARPPTRPAVPRVAEPARPRADPALRAAARPPRKGLGLSFEGPNRGLALASTGVALAGAGTFVALALRGLQLERQLAGSCAPACARQDVAAVRRQYLAADVGLGVAVVATAATIYLLVTNHPRGTPALAAIPHRGGGEVAFTSAF